MVNKKVLVFSLFAMLFTSFFANLAFAQTGTRQYQFHIYREIVNSEPLVNVDHATIEIFQNGQRLHTLNSDQNGRASVTLNAGSGYTITISASGYNSLSYPTFSVTASSEIASVDQPLTRSSGGSSRDVIALVRINGISPISEALVDFIKVSDGSVVPNGNDKITNSDGKTVAVSLTVGETYKLIVSKNGDTVTSSNFILTSGTLPLTKSVAVSSTFGSSSSNPTPPASPNCVDSDSNNEYGLQAYEERVAGHITSDGQTVRDTCYDDGTVIERYCASATNPIFSGTPVSCGAGYNCQLNSNGEASCVQSPFPGCGTRYSQYSGSSPGVGKTRVMLDIAFGDSVRACASGKIACEKVGRVCEKIEQKFTNSGSWQTSATSCDTLIAESNSLFLSAVCIAASTTPSTPPATDEDIPDDETNAPSGSKYYLEIIVRDSNGNPVEGATVHLERASLSGFSSGTTIFNRITNPSGYFAEPISSLNGGRYLQFLFGRTYSFRVTKPTTPAANSGDDESDDSSDSEFTWISGEGFTVEIDKGASCPLDMFAVGYHNRRTITCAEFLSKDGKKLKWGSGETRVALELLASGCRTNEGMLGFNKNGKPMCKKMIADGRNVKWDEETSSSKSLKSNCDRGDALTRVRWFDNVCSKLSYA